METIMQIVTALAAGALAVTPGAHGARVADTRVHVVRVPGLRRVIAPGIEASIQVPRGPGLCHPIAPRLPQRGTPDGIHPLEPLEAGRSRSLR